jgi:amino acid transporter
MTAKRHIRIGRFTALTSFLFGTVIFGLYYLTSDSMLLFVGYGFIVLTGLINIGVLIAIINIAAKDREHRKKLLKTCGLMTLNIPIMIGYCWVSIILLGTMRIIFTNETGVKLTDINIIGCGGGYIDKLEVGESETVWVPITGDCSISVNYLLDGQLKEETVAGYVTSSMGQKVKHEIDGQNKDMF